MDEQVVGLVGRDDELGILGRLLGPWLRQAFVPALSDNVRLVLSGREPPMTGWPTAMGVLFRELPLQNLRRGDVATLLERAGVTPDDADRIYQIARGHPLSLR